MPPAWEVLYRLPSRPCAKTPGHDGLRGSPVFVPKLYSLVKVKVCALAAVTPKSSATASIGAAIFDVSINSQVLKFSCFIQIDPVRGAKLSLTVRGPA